MAPCDTAPLLVPSGIARHFAGLASQRVGKRSHTLMQISHTLMEMTSFRVREMHAGMVRAEYRMGVWRED